VKKLLLALSGALLFSQAQAADMTRPVYKAAPVAMSGNFYVWVDGTYNRVRLPSSSLGFHAVGAAPTLLDSGPIQTFDNKLDGAGVRGAFGYVMPGSTLRFELGGSYVSADGSSQQTYSTPQAFITPVLLAGGGLGNALTCTAGLTCVTAGSHTSDYDAWEINGKAAWDVTLGSATVSPSLAVFGGNSRNREGLSQAFTQTLGAAVLNAMNYRADTRLRWTDFGARAGLDVRFPVFAGWTIDVGGWIGVAQRDVKLDGSDVLSTSFAFVGPRNSSLSVGDDRTVFLANAEAGLSYKFNPNFTIRGFAGLNYDSKVPGVSAPTYAGSIVVPGVGTAAGIVYSSETSYYAGGGVSLKF
jgi:hypothetical protein